MRKIRNQQIHSGNPGLMFAQGVELIINDHLNQPRKYETPQTGKKQRKVRKQDSSGNFFNLLMRQFAS